MRRLAAVLAAALLAVALVAVASAREESPLTVLAASSLTDVLPRIDGGPRYSFGGSNALATQLRNGAPADVFLSANTDIPAQLYRERVVEKPVVFTRNALVVVVPKSNPARIRSISDLTRKGVKVDVANPSVPVGEYTQKVLAKLRLTEAVRRNVVSEETDVREVLSKVALGQADAGFVYATDARTVAGRVRVIRLPARAQPNVTYALAVVARSGDRAAAHAFVAKVLGRKGQAELRRAGFLPLPKPK
jgi:molybdate transport system substrate-binding protein